MTVGTIEKRGQTRHAFSRTIEFCAPHRSPRKRFLGAGVNLSESGICIYTFDHLREGESIEILNALPAKHRMAVVRWVRAYSGDFYKVGLMFTD